MKVQEVMTHDVKTCAPDDTLNCAAQIMWEMDCGVAVIINRDRTPAGIVTDRDICMAAYTQNKPLTELPIRIAMSKAVIACHVDDSVAEVEKLMAQHQIRRLPVVDRGNHVVGVVSLGDLGRLMNKKRANDLSAEMIAETLARISTPRHGAATAAH